MGALVLGTSPQICEGDPQCQWCSPGGNTEGLGTGKGRVRTGDQGKFSGLMERVSSGGHFGPCHVVGLDEGTGTGS